MRRRHLVSLALLGFFTPDLWAQPAKEPPPPRPTPFGEPRRPGFLHAGLVGQTSKGAPAAAADADGRQPGVWQSRAPGPRLLEGKSRPADPPGALHPRRRLAGRRQEWPQCRRDP